MTRIQWVLVGVWACLSAGCLSGGYEKDFQDRLKEYRSEASGEPPAAAGEPGGPPDPLPANPQ